MMDTEQPTSECELRVKCKKNKLRQPSGELFSSCRTHQKYWWSKQQNKELLTFEQKQVFIERYPQPKVSVFSILYLLRNNTSYVIAKYYRETICKPFHTFTQDQHTKLTVWLHDFISIQIQAPEFQYRQLTVLFVSILYSLCNNI